MFYRRLFEIDPTTRGLFRATDMAAQRKKLLQTLAFAISGLDNLGALISKVEDLARRLWRHRRAIRFRGRCAVVDPGTGSRSRVDASRGVGVERSLSIAVRHHAQRCRARRAPTKCVACSV